MPLLAKMQAAMTPATGQSVFGFGIHLDWRPTTFVPELPSTSLCSLCGLYPAASVRLPCEHVLCESCYYYNSEVRSHCPLDDKAYREEALSVKFIEREEILGLRIRCWNAGNGCEAEDIASAMLDHFVSACNFHTVKCLMCDLKVLHRDLPSHVVSGCAGSRSPGKRHKNALSNGFHDASKMSTNTLQGNELLQKDVSTLETCNSTQGKKSEISVIACRIKAEPDRVKRATCCSWSPFLAAYLAF
ncbi:hypothetical protein HPB50_020941 [Hyalomma asiaticum]|uniref:Uncharacterized protein n=1 Tax=Hyalomma asiaticum TaxID=266040 RepID=A0ACB7SYM3_HYAAI|nr:hypothetical protein HPB50_020941 [Hyalomma asiaticum]